MIDHLSVGVSDIEKATQFYDAVLAEIGVKRLAAMDTLVAYGRSKVQFLAMLPFDKKTATFGNGTHIAFAAESEAQVSAFYKAVLENGGTCEGEPGKRPYPGFDVFTAYVRDPFGNKLEVISGGFSS